MELKPEMNRPNLEPSSRSFLLRKTGFRMTLTSTLPPRGSVHANSRTKELPMSTLMMKKSLMALAAVTTLSFAAPAFAAGGGSDGGGANQCPAGQVYDSATKSCVKKSSQLNDTQIYLFARQYAYAGKY